MATGRAIIATNSVGCKDTTTDGINGFLIPPYDSKILADKMIYFIENPEQINKMGIESRKIAQEKFDINKVNGILVKMVLNS
ncbi:glycosyltransferase [Campylobacter geochelonis]|uniref:glycosyltransferase n=1 Tax=Campylobacter geochelonis TaxID=1780362 RepID=UPI00094DA628|nr:glycosyltransferase [Campylobacter geochelonis]